MGEGEDKADENRDGKKGTIQYRGYSITDLYGKVKFVETAFLLIWGHLPSREEREKLEHDLAHVPLPGKEVFDVIRAFPYVYHISREILRTHTLISLMI